ncbi:hypothetical protein HMPREF0322_01297 [Desulfitobacterium hafniense DP7]|uniref:Uncharacterized protein n=1 Tax=Desulfitobacterium hafniense DP7 TaxID=537010 RepID=G9XK16_DESHA|nr:hypothetical protein HMPREF0322_01297 [Desulfitobacterium hafniense DP7]
MSFPENYFPGTPCHQVDYTKFVSKTIIGRTYKEIFLEGMPLII